MRSLTLYLLLVSSSVAICALGCASMHGAGSSRAGSSDPARGVLAPVVGSAPVSTANQQGVLNVAPQGNTGVNYSKITDMSLYLMALIMLIVFLSHRREMIRLGAHVVRESE